MYKNSQQSQKSLRSSRRILVAAIVMVFAIAVISGIYLARQPDHKTIKAVTASQSTKGEGSTPTSTNTPQQKETTTDQSQNSPTEPGDVKANSASGTTLTEPTGNYVSAHYNVPLNAALSSVCNTTSGATCQIKFTSGITTHTLPLQSTDRGGAVYWNSWTPTSIGLTPGIWQIQAVATLNGLSKTSTDALSLEVTQ